MGHISHSKSLPLIVKSIAYQKKEGVLLCSRTNKSIELFFRRGILVHICGELVNQPADEVLHELLAWPDFDIQWQSLQVTVPQTNINEETRLAFADVLQILTAGGSFDAPEKSRLVAGFFDKPVPAQIVVVPPTAYVETETDLPPIKIVEQPAPAPGYSVITDLLLPPGQAQNQLEELLAQVSFKEQLEALIRAHFTGYVYYKSQPGRGNLGEFGLVLLVDGRVADVLYSATGTGPRQSGMQAFQILEKLKLKLHICKVEVRILKAYRAMLTQAAPYRVVKATKESFGAVIQAFKRSGRDGVVLFNLDKLKLHYFFMFEGGTQVGIFGPDSKSGYLQPLSAPLAWPTSDSNAFLTIMLAGKIPVSDLSAKKPSTLTVPVTAGLAQPDIMELPVPGVVQWENLLGNVAARPRPTPAVLKAGYDDFNPYDF